MWKVYRYHAWLERRPLWQFALVSAGINLAAVIVVLVIAWQIVPHSWLPPPIFFAVGWTALMTAWQTRQRRKEMGL